ncbi:MAG: bifunctional [glutamate--ammonia ligase]-adenylyl-L-tyrosine phosphorylase/[glutamate--ammonia-ligase] adenylyltransferase [Zavarzinella sp.]
MNETMPDSESDVQAPSWDHIRAALGERFSLLEPSLAEVVPRLSDPHLALQSFTRLCGDGAFQEILFATLGDMTVDLEQLLNILSCSAFFADVIARHPDVLQELLLRSPKRYRREELIDELQQQVGQQTHDELVVQHLRDFRSRQQLRVGVNDIIHDRPIEEITANLSHIADAIITVAWDYAQKKLIARYGQPRDLRHQPVCAAIFAFGKLGGEELNYSSDVDLLVIYGEEGQTDSQRPISNEEFFSRCAMELIRLLSQHNDRGNAYRVDFRLRPEGKHGPLARSWRSTLNYYDTRCRTWERQALIKLRPVAGDMSLGEQFLEAISPIIYKRFLSFSEINEIKAMKRKIEHNAQKAGGTREVKTGPGGIRDVEFAIQFLQMLNGGDLLEIRKRDTLGAIQALEIAGCLTVAESIGLSESYRFLRKVEHRLQVMFDLQVHQLPDDTQELRLLAARLGYRDRVQAGINRVVVSIDGQIAPQRFSPLDEANSPPGTKALLFEALDQFLHDYFEKTRLNRTILNHLLHQAFPNDSTAEPESDLILETDPDPATIQSVLGKYPFADVQTAWKNLSLLGQEQPFLSSRRCRHFLAGIAPQLIRAVAAMPDPDLALTNLEQVTASLGAKAVLWEVFSFNPPTLQLYIDVCDSPFLAQILINNPGMIDELLDSLILNRPRTRDDLQNELVELLRGVERKEIIEAILHSFQDKEILRIAVRDLLGKDDIRSVTTALSDVGEAILCESAKIASRICRQSKVPPPPFVILAMGKLGSREMSYHSDLDLVLVYANDSGNRQQQDGYEYYTEYARKLIHTLSYMGPHGRLYEIDMRLRPTGQSGSLAVSLDSFQRYFQADGPAQLWERQSLTRGRIIYGDPTFAEQVMDACRTAIHAVPWSPQLFSEIVQMRSRLEAKGSKRSLKRREGGMNDIEFLVQYFQLRYGKSHPEIMLANTWECLDALWNAGLIREEDHQQLTSSYSFYRFAEARLRIVTNRPNNEYPEDSRLLEQFSCRLGYHPNPTGGATEEFLLQLQENAQKTRRIFFKYLRPESFPSE